VQVVRKRFSSRVSTLTRDIDIAILSVGLSVSDVPVLDENGLTYCHRRFPGAREMRESRRRLGACVRVPYSVYCVLIQSSDTLLQITHFNVM